MYRRKVGCLFCGENYKDPLGSAPAVFTPATGLMKPSPCSCRSHLDCREKDRRSWEVSIEWLASPFSFRALPHVHQPQLLVFLTAAMSWEGVLHLVSGLLPITPPLCPRSLDWHPWPLRPSWLPGSLHASRRHGLLTTGLTYLGDILDQGLILDL